MDKMDKLDLPVLKGQLARVEKPVQMETEATLAKWDQMALRDKKVTVVNVVAKGTTACKVYRGLAVLKDQGVYKVLKVTMAKEPRLIYLVGLSQ